MAVYLKWPTLISDGLHHLMMLAWHTLSAQRQLHAWRTGSAQTVHAPRPISKEKAVAFTFLFFLLFRLENRSAR